ncbi:MAG: saccharopine dehydrogenase NADP-binding domain-containing protein [Anaerolineales bacterium]
MNRMIVAGGTGFFGAALVGLLKSEGIQPVLAARHGPVDLRLDVEDPDSLRSVLRPGDLVLDAVGPFQGRSTALVEAAIEIGADLIDLSDSLDYSEMLIGLETRIAQSGIRVLTACSSISVGSAALIRLSHIESPVAASGFLVPAARHVAWPGTGGSLLNSVGRSIRIWQSGALVSKRGWGSARQFEFPRPLGVKTGYLFESADALMLPRIWPGLRAVDFFVSSNVPGFNAVFRAAARWKLIRALVVRMAPLGLSIARRIGGRIGCLAYQIQAEDGRRARLGLIGPDRSYLTPVAPMVLAARRIAAGRFEPRGLVPADQQVGDTELIEYLATLGVQLVRLEDPANPLPA